MSTPGKTSSGKTLSGKIPEDLPCDWTLRLMGEAVNYRATSSGVFKSKAMDQLDKWARELGCEGDYGLYSDQVEVMIVKRKKLME